MKPDYRMIISSWSWPSALSKAILWKLNYNIESANTVLSYKIAQTICNGRPNNRIDTITKMELNIAGIR